MRYGRTGPGLSSFSREYGCRGYPLRLSVGVLSGSAPPPCFTGGRIPTPFNAPFRRRARVSLLCPCLESLSGAGILTGCPSAAPFGSALGPDLPWSDYRLPGTLGLPVCGFPTRIIVTYAYICFSASSSTPRGAPSPAAECSPTNNLLFHGFGSVLHARLLSTPCRSTSELLRTL